MLVEGEVGLRGADVLHVGDVALHVFTLAVDDGVCFGGIRRARCRPVVELRPHRRGLCGAICRTGHSLRCRRRHLVCNR